ncbi:MAG: diguanylate cyclase [Herbinix sp.]|nr:diguanylate cyclase [Herbinix sp.]
MNCRIRRTVVVILFLAYLIAIFLKSDFWGNILSPMVTLLTFYEVYRAFFLDREPRHKNLAGLILAASILVWGMSDILWAVTEMGFHSDPEESFLVTFGYFLTNIFLVISLSMYGISEFRKWNIMQVALDTVVNVFFVIELIWIFFLDRRMMNLIELQTDYISLVSIISDIIMLIWIVIWFMSFRNGKLPRFIKFMAAGVLLYAITDLIYYYQYFYSEYDPNTLIDSVYVLSFLLIAIAGILRSSTAIGGVTTKNFNIGNKRKGYYLLIMPALVLIFKGFVALELLHFIFVILMYHLISNYIQINIIKNAQLEKEMELNSILELKVRERTEELLQKNIILEDMVNHDLVTGLKNRRYLLAYLDNEIKLLKDKETMILLYIDLNRFKMISTMFGHYIGECILLGMGERLSQLEHEVPDSLLASYGEDMFVYVARGNYDYSQGQALAKRVIELGSDIYKLVDYQLRITVNIGISIYPYDAASKEELIKHADIAMSHARTFGFNTIKEYDLQLSEVFHRRNSIEIMMKKVDFAHEFMLYYQPQLRTNDRRVIGFEALIRWKTANGELIPPGEFIPIAEETGYIVPIGAWVMKTALKQLSEWNKIGKSKIKIGINVSLRQFDTHVFMENLFEEIKHLELQPEYIDLEIIESIQLQSNPEMIQILEEIRSHGITVSIDDFGTGFSSLSYLKNLPVDRIKLARELVQSVHMDEFDYQLIKSIIEISRAKGIKVIAEGVETEEQWAALKELQCDEVQGYLFGKAMLPVELESIYKELQ